MIEKNRGGVSCMQHTSKEVLYFSLDARKLEPPFA